MKKSLHIFAILFLAVSACKKEDIILKEKELLVSEISNSNGEKWSFVYDKDSRVQFFQKAFDNYTVRYDIFYNGLNQISSIQAYYLNDVESRTEHFFSYDFEGKLKVSENTSDPDNILVVNYQKDFITYDYAKVQDLTYYLEDGNIVKENCFNCGPIIDEYKYSTFEIAIPQELKNVWPVTYSVPKFLGTNRILSKNIPIAYSEAQLSWGGELINEIETNEAGLPVKVKTHQGKAAYGTSKPEKTVWSIGYIML
jgi:hypothetical protein